MELDLTARKKLRVKIGSDEFYDVRIPTVLEADAYQESLKNKEGRVGVAFLGFLDSLGLPKAKSEQLDITQVESLAEHLMGMVKKK